MDKASMKRVLLAPLDPVHDIGLKMIRRGLEEAGHETILLPPDYTLEEVVQAISEHDVDSVLISRTLGYGVAELLARFVDLADAAGVRKKVRLAVGGMAIRPELAAELGFDAGFGPGTTVQEAVAFVEGREYNRVAAKKAKDKPAFPGNYSYRYQHSRIGELLEQITEGILAWAAGKTSPGIRRARIRQEMLHASKGGAEYKNLLDKYRGLSDPLVGDFYRSGKLPERVRRLTDNEIESFRRFVADSQERLVSKRIQRSRQRPLVFIQYGTGSPVLDITHVKVTEGWGADGAVHFDPSWAARTEGFLEGYLDHSGDGSVITPENLSLVRNSLAGSTLWQVRAHRGLNTPETVMLAGEIGADLTKINMVYASLGAGNDPARITIDGLECIRLAAQYNLPFDVVTNEELCGVPAFKAFAGMLIVAHLGAKLGGRPILQPLFCYSPEVMVGGQMADNYVDFNAAKIRALRSIIDAPVWPGAPIGFLTQAEDRVQSSVTTALHAMLATSLEVDAISIASSDEAYSGGPIVSASRVDTLRAVAETFRFLGQATITPTAKAEVWADGIVEGIRQVLEQVARGDTFVDALYSGVLGSTEDGAYPGRSGRGTVEED